MVDNYINNDYIFGYKIYNINCDYSKPNEKSNGACIKQKYYYLESREAINKHFHCYRKESRAFKYYYAPVFN